MRVDDFINVKAFAKLKKWIYNAVQENVLVS